MPEEIRADLLLGRDTLSPGMVKAGRAAADASSNVRQLTRGLYEVSKQRATPVVDLNDAAATAKLGEVSAKLKELGARVADPKVDLEDKKALASVATMRVRLDELGKKVSSPRVTLEGLARAEAKLLTLDAQLDALDGRTVDVTVDVDRHRGIFSRLGGLFGGIGGGGGAAAAGARRAGAAGRRGWARASRGWGRAARSRWASGPRWPPLLRPPSSRSASAAWPAAVPPPGRSPSASGKMSSCRS